MEGRNGVTGKGGEAGGRRSGRDNWQVAQNSSRSRPPCGVGLTYSGKEGSVENKLHTKLNFLRYPHILHHSQKKLWGGGGEEGQVKEGDLGLSRSCFTRENRGRNRNEKGENYRKGLKGVQVHIPRVYVSRNIVFDAGQNSGGRGGGAKSKLAGTGSHRDIQGGR